jgi:hypothetical protein
MPKLALLYTLFALVSCNHNPPITTPPVAPAPPVPAAHAIPPKLLSVRKIWDAAPHNAFTDLVRFKNDWYCAFREGSAHIPGTDGVIRVIRSPDGQKWESVAQVAKQGIDLRDAKLSVTPDHQLMLLMGGSVYAGQPPQPNRAFTGLRTRVSFSSDGQRFTPPQDVADANQWLWRIAWHGDEAYGAAYGTAAGRESPTLTFYRTTDGLLFDKIADLKPPNVPSEATTRFLSDGTMLMLVRGEGRGARAALGVAKPPYTQWTWQDTGRPLQGQDFIVLPDGRIFYAARDYPDGKTAKTTVGEIDLAGPPKKELCRPLITLPSGGDTSYPGMALADDGTLLISYYSSHEGKSAIYLARIAVTPNKDP